jgi:hypothetical protein
MMALVMVLSFSPTGYVRVAAEETSKLTVAEVEDYVDEILSAIPTADDYTSTAYSSSLAEKIEQLADFLKTADSGDVSTLDGHITGETNSTYTSIQTFSAAYSAKQSEILESKADELKAALEAFLSSKFTKESYEATLALYEDSMVRATLDARHDSSTGTVDSNLRHFANIKDLMDCISEVETYINNITGLKKEDDYTKFKKTVEDAEEQYDEAESNFEILLQSNPYKDCLGDYSDVGKLISNMDAYEQAELKLKVEEAYHNIGSFTVMTDEVKKKIAVLAAAVEEADKTKTDEKTGVSVTDLYNGSQIRNLLKQYKKVVKFEEEADNLPSELLNLTQVAQAMALYETGYASLDEETQAMIPEEYASKVLYALNVSTGSESVVEKIASIGAITGEEDFEEVSNRYDKAYAAYRSFVTRYAGISSVSDLITNASILDDESSVIELIKTIDSLKGLENVTLSSQSPQLESVNYAYDNMSKSQQEQVYNIDEFNEIYEDVMAAQNVTTLIASICNNFTLEDEEFIQSIRESYNALNDKAKGYVGASKYAVLGAAEQQLQALNQNVAERTSQLISKIGKVTAASKESISKARTSYDSLNASQKLLVSNYSVLTAAESSYKELDVSLEKATITGLGTYTYSGQAVKPSITVKLNGDTLVQDIDYTVSYLSNTGAGTAKMILEGIGDYTGTQTKTFTIKKGSMTVADVSGYKASYSYTGKKVKPVPVVKMGDNTLVKNRDYTVSYSSNKNVGTAKIKIKGKGNYTGTVTKSFKIKKVSVKKVSLSGVKKEYSWTGGKITPTVTLKWKGKKLVKNKDYTITFRNNQQKGKATILIKGKSNFKKTRKITFKID